jgi:hypothetical protein
MQYRAFVLGLAAAALIAAPAWAKHGKAGLWNVTSTTDVGLPAKTVAAMKKLGEPIAAAQPVTVPMCMSQAEVDADTPPHLDRAATGCVMKVVTQTPAVLKASMLCKGAMKGTGGIEVSYRGAEHYAGTYNFKGTLNGRPTDVTTRFKGDWVKADCGKVQPYRLRTQ